MKTDEQSDEHHLSPGPAADDKAIRQLIEMADEAVGPIHLVEESTIDSEIDYVGDKPPEYFQKLAQKAAAAAAKRYSQRRDPIPPLVVSALRAGEPDSLACERASGDLIETELEQLIEKFAPPEYFNDAVN